MIWTGSRSFNLGLLMKPFFRGSSEKWFLGIRMVKMLTNGGPQIHFQKAPKLSKEWGSPQPVRPAFKMAVMTALVALEADVGLEDPDP